MILYLKNRKGFIQLALKSGSVDIRDNLFLDCFRGSLVPVISFGENELYQRRSVFELISDVIPWGRTILGVLPLPRSVFTLDTDLTK